MKPQFFVLLVCLIGVAVSAVVIELQSHGQAQVNRGELVLGLSGLANSLQEYYARSRELVPDADFGYHFPGIPVGASGVLALGHADRDSYGSYRVQQVLLYEKVVLRAVGIEQGNNTTRPVIVDAEVYPDTVLFRVVN